MLAKLYFYSWLVTTAAFLIFTVAGSMTTFTLVVFGFIAFGLVFMGMIAVLPSIAAHPPQYAEPSAPKVSPKPVAAPIQHGAHSIRA